MERRRFLRWLAVGAAALGGAAAWRGAGYSVPAEVARELRVLSPWQYAVVAAVGARIVEPEQVDVGRFTDGYAVGLPARDRDELLALIAVVEHVAPVARGYARRFTSLAAAEQDQVLASLEQSRVGLLRAGFQALKALSLMACYRRPESWTALGYPGPVVRWSPG